jgi:tol-pal system protein YbgF
MRKSPSSRGFVLFTAAMVLALAVTFEESPLEEFSDFPLIRRAILPGAGLSGVSAAAAQTKGKKAPASKPDEGILKAIRSLGATLQGLRRALADQELRLEEARKAIQSLADQLERGQGAQAEEQAKFGSILEGLRERLDSMENELTGLRFSDVRRGKADIGAASGKEKPVGAPVTESHVGLSVASQEFAVSPAGAPSAGIAPVGVARANASASPLMENGAAVAKVTPATDPGPEAEFNEALQVLREERQFPRARLLFTRFLSKNPTHDLADDAQYWIGDSYFGERNFERAILAFNKVQVDYANGDKAPDALLKEALSFLRLGDKASAWELFERVAKKYPQSEAGRTALEQLKNF